MMWFVFVLGAMLGVSGRHSWGDAMRVKAQDLLKKEREYNGEEIKRLRTQVANLIGLTSPSSPPPLPEKAP